MRFLHDCPEPEVMIVFACPKYGMRALPLPASSAVRVARRATLDIYLSTAFRARPRATNRPYGA